MISSVSTPKIGIIFGFANSCVDFLALQKTLFYDT